MRRNDRGPVNNVFDTVTVFILSIIVYGYYALVLKPGFVSSDVIHFLDDLHLNDGLIELVLQRISDLGCDLIYDAYSIICFHITQNMFAMGLIQIVIVSMLNVWCWRVLRKYSHIVIAMIVLMCMLLSPVHAMLALWYHRSSMFAILVFINLLFLYQVGKRVKLKLHEEVLFICNLIVMSNMRIDGIVIALPSLVMYLLGSKKNKWVIAGILDIFLLIFLWVHLSAPTNNMAQKALLPQRLTSYVRIAHQTEKTELTEADKGTIASLVKNDNKEENWFTRDINAAFKPNMFKSRSDEMTMLKWGTGFVLRNLLPFIVGQIHNFYETAFLGQSQLLYVVRFAEQEDVLNTRIQEHVDFRMQESNRLPFRIYERLTSLIQEPLLSNKYAFTTKMIFGTYIPFNLVIIYLIIAILRNKKSYVCLVPLFIYAGFILLFQSKPRAYYWCWLAFSHYFIAFALGYDVLQKQEDIVNQ